MAFPSTISSLVDPYNYGCGGPFVSSTGSVYVVTTVSANQLHVFKSADPSSSWAGAGTDPTITSAAQIWWVDVCQVGDILHVATRDGADAANQQIRYHVFDMSSDTWTTTNTLVKTTYTCAAPVYQTRVKIIVRGDGNKFIMYEGPQVLADIQRARVYYARHMGAAWSADIALDNGGNVHWYPQEAILGSADRIHFFLLDFTNGTLYQRCLTSANALQSFPTSFATVPAGQPDLCYQRGLSYSGSAGGTLVVQPYYADYNNLATTRFTSSDAPVPAGMTITSDITGTFNPESSNNLRANASLAKDDNTVYNTFVDSALDIYIQSSQDAGSWSIASQFLVASATEVFTSIFTRNSAKVLSIVYYQVASTETKYTEFTLSTAATTSVRNFGMMLGVGR